MNQHEIDKQVFALYDEYCHGAFDRREFLRRASSLSVVGVPALTMAEALLPQYAKAQTISFTDTRINGTYVEYPSPGGTSGKMRGYLVQPTTQGPYPVVLVIHENRGLNPYIEDVARRLAIVGYMAFAPDGLTSVGGYPGDDEKGLELFRSVDAAKMRADFIAAAAWLKSHADSTGKLGAVGFCYGGGIVNQLAVHMGSDLAAGVPFYGAQPKAEDVAKIKTPLNAQYGELDTRITSGWPDFDAALTAARVPHEGHIYKGANHGFHNDTTPRYDEAAAKEAWQRTLDWFNKYLKVAA